MLKLKVKPQVITTSPQSPQGDNQVDNQGDNQVVEQPEKKKIKVLYKVNKFDTQFMNNLRSCGIQDDVANEFNLALNNYFLENCKYTMHALCLYKNIVFNMMKDNKTII